METAAEIVEYVTRAGLAVFLILVIVGGSRKWWVFGHAYTAMEAERDAYKKQVDDLTVILLQREIRDHTEPMDDTRRH